MCIRDRDDYGQTGNENSHSDEGEGGEEYLSLIHICLSPAYDVMFTANTWENSSAHIHSMGVMGKRLSLIHI